MNDTLLPHQAEYRALAEKAAETLYRKAGVPAPERFIWFRSPFELREHLAAKRLYDSLYKTLFPSEYTTLQIPSSRIIPVNWQFTRSLPSPVRAELWWGKIPDRNVCFYRDALPVMEVNYNNFENTMSEQQRVLLRALRQAARTLDVVAPFANACIMSDLPVKTHKDAQGRLHSQTEAAVTYSDGWKVYAIEGVNVPKWYIEQPDKITSHEIDKCSNVTWCRIMLRLYRGDYYADCGATLEAIDGTGRLYRKQRQNDSDFVFVRVKNSTREPDGTFREYVLRVPPKIKTPLEAVAWTFRMTAEEYLKTQKMT